MLGRIDDEPVVRMTNFLGGCLAGPAACFFTVLGMMAQAGWASEPPTIYASMACKASEGQFRFATSLTADGLLDDGTTLDDIGSLARDGFRCSMGGHVFTVSVASFRGSSDKGECGSWASGAFEVRVDGKMAASVPAPNCLTGRITKVWITLRKIGAAFSVSTEEQDRKD